jgi:membrane protein YqaA with SNARE-associated domain
MHPGAHGLLTVAIADSSVVPVPLTGSSDLILLWSVARNGNPWLLAATIVSGSTLGGFSRWELGKVGG